MDFTNINDPAGVKALLDQLRTSQAWQELKEESKTPSPSHPNLSRSDRTHTLSLEPEPELEPVVSDHISSLLSRLQPGGGSGQLPSAPANWTPNSRVLQRDTHTDSPHPSDAIIHPSPPSIPFSSPRTKDPRFLAFNQALPVISRLSEDAGFMEKLEKLRADQVQLERKLWEERSQIIKAQVERLQVAQAKGAILGTGLGQRDAMTLQASFEKELKTFDREQVLAAWDALIAKQQAALEALGVPSMFTTIASADREKQQRIVQVLDGLSDPINDDVEP